MAKCMQNNKESDVQEGHVNVRACNKFYFGKVNCRTIKSLRKQAMHMFRLQASICLQFLTIYCFVCVHSYNRKRG